MKRPAIPTVAVVVAVALVALLVYGLLAKGTDNTLDDAVSRGDRPLAPGAAMRLPVLGDDDRTRSIDDFRGRIVILNFWASWCVPCQDEAPLLDDAQRALAEDERGTVLGATYNDAPYQSEEFARRFGIDFPVVRDVGTELAAEFGTSKLPETFVIDPAGRIVAINRGVLSREFLDEAIAKAGR